MQQVLLAEQGRGVTRDLLQILAVGTRFLLAFSRQEEGLKHMQLWNVIPRIDPNMQKARGILYENQDKEKIWRFYDELLSTAT